MKEGDPKEREKKGGGEEEVKEVYCSCGEPCVRGSWGVVVRLLFEIYEKGEGESEREKKLVDFLAASGIFGVDLVIIYLFIILSF